MELDLSNTVTDIGLAYRGVITYGVFCRLGGVKARTCIIP